MKNFFRPVFDLVLFGNLFISLCAVAQAMVTFTLIGSKAVYPLVVLLFSSTVFIYNISLLLTKPVEPESSPLLPIRWFFAHQRLMVATTLLSAGVMFFMFLLVSVRSEIALVFLSILSVGYSLPIFKKGDQKFGLRNIPGIKSALISLVWTMSCVLLPILEARAHHLADVSIADAAILIAKRFLFIMALTIPFDIRDLFHDSKSGLKTIPVIFGERGAYLFCQFLLAGYLILLFLFKGDGFSRNFFALGTTTILTGWLIFRAKLEKNEYYYFFFMDGVLILQYIVLLLFNLVR